MENSEILELSIENLRIARENLKDKGEAYLKLYINYCNRHDLYMNEIDGTREDFERIEKNINFIDRLLEKCENEK